MTSNAPMDTKAPRTAKEDGEGRRKHRSSSGSSSPGAQASFNPRHPSAPDDATAALVSSSPTADSISMPLGKSKASSSPTAYRHPNHTKSEPEVKPPQHPGPQNGRNHVPQNGKSSRPGSHPHGSHSEPRSVSGHGPSGAWASGHGAAGAWATKYTETNLASPSISALAHDAASSAVTASPAPRAATSHPSPGKSKVSAATVPSSRPAETTAPTQAWASPSSSSSRFSSDGMKKSASSDGLHSSVEGLPGKRRSGSGSEARSGRALPWQGGLPQASNSVSDGAGRVPAAGPRVAPASLNLPRVAAPIPQPPLGKGVTAGGGATQNRSRSRSSASYSNSSPKNQSASRTGNNSIGVGFARAGGGSERPPSRSGSPGLYDSNNGSLRSGSLSRKVSSSLRESSSPSSAAVGSLEPPLTPSSTDLERFLNQVCAIMCKKK